MAPCNRNRLVSRPFSGKFFSNDANHEFFPISLFNYYSALYCKKRYRRFQKMTQIFAIFCGFKPQKFANPLLSLIFIGDWNKKKRIRDFLDFLGVIFCFIITKKLLKNDSNIAFCGFTGLTEFLLPKRTLYFKCDFPFRYLKTSDFVWKP